MPMPPQDSKFSEHHPVFEDSSPNFWESGLKDVPEFLKQGLDLGKVQQVATKPQTIQEQKAIAGVDSDNPYLVKVFDKGNYSTPVLNHELTHTFQDTRNSELPQVSSNKVSPGRSGYEYGGISGLVEARKKGKTISDFNYEQQAEMVKDYKTKHDEYLKKASSGNISPSVEKEMYDLQQAFHPFIKQLAEMPSNKENLKRNPLLELLGIQKTPTIDTKPETPGLPSYDTPGLGILPADKLMGGNSQPTKPKNLSESLAGKRKIEIR